MNAQVSLPCLCATVRRAARTLTSFYDEALHRHGITVTQFTILQALQLAGPVAQGRLGEILAIDSTTLTRSLRVLIRNGWIERAEGKDRRAWRLNLSRQGKLKYEAVLPDWEAAQRTLRRKLGPNAWLETFQLGDQLTTAAKSAGEKQ
jgi:DNA-binding MarR family transcriptional regulator